MSMTSPTDCLSSKNIHSKSSQWGKEKDNTKKGIQGHYPQGLICMSLIEGLIDIRVIE